MNRDFIASFIIAAGCFGFFTLAVPQYDLLLDVQDALTKQRELLAQRRAMADNFKNLYDQYQQRLSDIDRMNVFLPDYSHDDQILSGVEQAVSENTFQLRSATIVPLKENKPGPVQKTAIKIEMAGDPQNLAGLLTRLEESLRIYDVTEIVVARDIQAGQGNNAFLFEIKLNAYYKKI